MLALLSSSSYILPVLSGFIVILLSITFTYLNARPPPASNTKVSHGNLPIFGAVDFFWKRYDFFVRAIEQTRSGIFSFYVGTELVIGISGEAARKVYFESRELDFGQGYAGLFGMGPRTLPEDDGNNDYNWTVNSLSRLLKSEVFKASLPDLLNITQSRIGELASQTTTADGYVVTDPFDSVYRIVFHLT